MPRLARNACGAHKARLAVEVAIVVATCAERTERTEALAGELQPPSEEVVEAVSPRRRMYLGACRQDSVEVKEARSNAARQSERARGRAGAHQAMVKWDAFLVCERVEEPRSPHAFVGQSAFEGAELVGAKTDAATAAACGGQHILRPEQREPPIGAQLIKCAWRCRRTPTVARPIRRGRRTARPARDTRNPNSTVRARHSVVNRPERLPSDMGEGHSAVTGTGVWTSWEMFGGISGRASPSRATSTSASARTPGAALPRT